VKLHSVAQCFLHRTICEIVYSAVNLPTFLFRMDDGCGTMKPCLFLHALG